MTLWRDMRFAARMLGKSPAFTAVAVLSLALGIGANTAIFSVAGAVLSNSPKVKEPSRVFDVRGESNEDERFAVSYPAYRQMRDGSTALEGLLCWGELPLSLGTGGGQPEQAFGMIVSANYFDVLRVAPERGRFFTPEEEAEQGAHPVAVLSHAAWARRFGADPAAVGQSVRLNGQQFTVVGVAPKGFTSTFPFYAPDVFVPVSMQRQVLPTSDMLGTIHAEWLQLTGRLKEGVTVEQARAELSTLRARFEDAHPELGRPGLGEPERPRGRSVELVPVGAFPRNFRGMLYGFTALLLVIVNLVLFIACANLTSLLLARAAARRREVAVRLALGAGRWRVVRQLLTESVLLCLLGGVVGALFALWMTDLLFAFKPAVHIPIEIAPRLDWRVLGWTLFVSLSTGVLFGLAPALQATRADVSRALKGEPAAGGRRSRLRDLFVGAQVAVTVLLLVSAGLFLRALTYAREVRPGADPEQVQTASFNPQVLGYTDERARDFYRRLLDRVRAAPGVEAASLALMVPVGSTQAAVGIGVEGHESFNWSDTNDEHSEAMIRADYNVITPGYFDTVGIPVLRGRDFREGDEARNVAVVDEAFARRFFPDTDPVGKRLRKDSTVFEIVGVARSNTFRVKGEEPRPFLYLPYGREGADAFFAQRMILHVRGARGVAPAEVYETIRREAAAVDVNVAPEFMMSVAEHQSVALLPQRVLSGVAGVFGLLGLVLASVGVFGMVSYAVAQRTHEIGVRMALGARGRDVLLLVLREGMKVTLAGVLAGLLCALALTRLLEGLLYGVSAADPATFGGVALLLGTVALLAAYVPARRATKVDPVEALRYE
ncbi:MAG: ABC transporter permease [Acidobacteria bacterium]|nr:ABC transporter permease [Acidobacteriota bacterium]